MSKITVTDEQVETVISLMREILKELRQNAKNRQKALETWKVGHERNGA